jgi:hypothetical protein
MTLRSIRTVVAVAVAAQGLVSTFQTETLARPYRHFGFVLAAGTTSPSVSATGCADQPAMTFAGTVVATRDDLAAGMYPLAFSGMSDTCETLTNGHGFGTLTGALAGTVEYTRTAGIVTLDGTMSINNSGSVTTVLCGIAPTSDATLASYTLTCEIVV